MTPTAELLDWLTADKAFQAAYRRLLIESTATQFSALEITKTSHDWNYLLRCGSFLARSENARMHDIALRIAQHCLHQSTTVSEQQKNSAQFILNALANRRAIDLATARGLLTGEFATWRESFVGNMNWIKEEIKHSVWLKNGERINVNVFQKDFWDALENYQTLSISAPTSAGKSHLIKQWILERLNGGDAPVVVYLVPTRALISEVELDFQKALSKEIKKSTVNLSSFPFGKFSDDAKPTVFVLTQERLQLLMQRMSRKIDVVIVDEAYKLADDDRGILLQHVIERVLLSNTSAKVVYISPLASNPEILISNVHNGFSAKFDDVTVNQNLIWLSQKRGPNWTLELCQPDGTIPLGDLKLTSNPSPASLRMPMLAYTLGQEGGSILYVNRAADAEKAASQLCDLIGFENVRNDQPLLDLIELCEKVIHKDFKLIDCLKYGVAFHYGNMPLIIRDEIETLFRDGVITFLVCTSTLVEGVNLPCRNIFIKSPKRGDEPMNAGDFWNLAGRAGRWGKDFQGNIFCLDPTIWNAPQTKTLYALSRATEEVLKKESEVIQFIEEGTPRAIAAKSRGLESMASYLAISHNQYGSIAMVPWIKSLSLTNIDTLDAAVEKYLTSSAIPIDIVQANPGISPLAMAEMLNFFRTFRGSVENLLVPFATDTDATTGYVQVFQSMFGRLTNEFGNNDKFLFRQAIVTVNWMQGRPLARIIQERQNVASVDEDIHKTIREVLHDVENVARYKAPKYVSCYNDVLKYFLNSTGRQDLADQIDDIAMYLEMGVNTGTHLSLMNLGLSRTSAIELKEYITASDLSEKQCLDWLIQPNNNWKSRSMPKIVIREIERMLAVHVN